MEVLEFDAQKHIHVLDQAIRELLDQVRKRCYLTVPYFVPPTWLVEGPIRAARRGVDVQVLTAGKSDVSLARIAGRHVYGELLTAGGQTFEMQHPTLHAKNLVIDGRYSLSGSYNIDRYGGKHNLEVGIKVYDEDLANALEREFLSNLRCSKEVTLKTWRRRPWHTRWVQGLLYQVARL